MIDSFYKDRTLLITGGTGFLGQALIAKVLRSLPQVRRIYALIRPRKRADGRVVSAAERLEEELFAASVLASFRSADAQGFAAARQKVVAIEGDITSPDLGLAPQLLSQVCAEVDAIVNSAATVVFDEPLDLAIRLNTLGPLNLLAFARNCRPGTALLHISTAYVNGQLPGRIPEELLPPDRSIHQLMHPGTDGGPFDPEAEIADCQAYCRRIYEQAATPRQEQLFRRAILSQSRNRRLTEKRLAQLVADRRKGWVERELVAEGMRRSRALGWTDVYTFTKAMGEQMLVRQRGELSLVILRPSIIESSLEDPEPGWISGLKVTDPLIAAYGRGMMPDFPAKPDMLIDVIPVDFVVDAVLAALTQASRDEVRVFQMATSSENPIRISSLFNHVRAYFQAHPLRDREGREPPLPPWTYPSVRRFIWNFHLRYLWPLRVREWLLDHLPAALVSTAKKRLLSTLRIRLQRVLYYTRIYHPYTQLNCAFETRRIQELYASLPAAEQRRFNLDVRRIDWENYVQRVHLPGLRRHVLRDERGDEALFREAPGEVGAEEERWHAEGEVETIPDLLRWACGHYADRVALQIRRRGQWVRYTYRQVQEQVERMAGQWQALGLEPGQRVLLCGANGPEWVVAYLAASSLGLAVVPLDVQTREEEVWGLAEFTRARALVASPACFTRLAPKAVAARRPALWFLDLEAGGRPFAQAGAAGAGGPAGPARPLRVTPDLTASIIFTCGTAVEPRGAVLTHRNFIADLLALAEVQRLYETDQILSLLPLHHGLEFTGGLLMSLWGGATTTYLETFNSREILETMRTTGTTVLLAVPRLLKILADRILRLEAQAGEGERAPRSLSLTGVRLIVSGGAPLAPEVFDAYQRLGVPVHEGYGLTEAGPIATVNPPERIRRGSVGQALPGVELAIDRPDAEGRGEILVRGPNVMAGYYEKPELTGQVLQDGWLHTGDIGYLGEGGYLYITGRAKSLIVTGAGKNVYPEEVEALYRDLPHVAEMAVVGVRSPRTLSEEVHGVVVLAPGEEDGGEQVQARAYQISRSLPAYQRLQRLHLWRRPLPRQEDGQVDRQALLAELQLERQRGSELVEIDESLPPWERQVYHLASQVTGLTPGEVMAHAEAPLDTLMDSLMAVEFAAVLESRSGAALGPWDRSRRSLREVLEELEPHLAGREAFLVAGQGGTPSDSYWSRFLGRGEELAVSPATGWGRRLLQGVLWGVGGGLFRNYFSLQVEGLEHLPQDRPYLIAANHASHLDSLAVLLALRCRVDQLSLAAARDYFFHSPLRDWALRTLLNAVPFDRQDRFQDSLLQVRGLLGPRRPLLVFPEGTRSVSGQLQPFKAGVGLLALELDLPVVPVHIWGTYQAMPRGHRRPCRHPIAVRVGKPVEMAPYRLRRERLNCYEVYREIVEALRREIEALGAARLQGQAG